MEDMYIIEYWIGNARKLYTTADTQGAYKFYSEQSKARLLQVKYDETIEDVKMKLQYDLFYIENISVRLDLKIIWRTVFVVLFGKGHFG